MKTRTLKPLFMLPTIESVRYRTLLFISMLFALSLTLQGCIGGEEKSKVAEASINIDDSPSVFFLVESKKETDDEGRDTYYSFVGEAIAFPRHIFSNSDHARLDISKSYWADASSVMIQDNNTSLKVTDGHKPSVKACMVPKLSNGKSGSETCVTFEVRDLPSLASKVKTVSVSADNDHFQVGIQLTELEPNDVRDTEGTVWQYRWFDKDSNLLKKSGDAITGYKLDYVDIDERIKSVKACIFDIVTQQCVKESSLEIVPSNNVPTVTILDITGEYNQGGKVFPESQTSYAFTQPAEDFTYEWAVAGVALSDEEKSASELVLRDASFFGVDITVCMQRAYKNFTGTGTETTEKACRTKQFAETDVQVSASYSYGHNILAQGASLVFSGSFNGIDAIDYSTFKLTYLGNVLVRDSDYSISTFGHNDFSFKIHSQQLAPTTEYGAIMRLQCEFTYNSQLYSCIGGSSPSDEVSIYKTGGLPDLKSKVVGAIAEKNRIAFKECAAGDKLTWWLKDKGTANYIQTGDEEVIQQGNICYGNAADGSLYINESWAEKSLKLIVKRARNGLPDERIQVLNIELGEISK